MEFRHRTELKHIHDRVLVVVELDELPIADRTRLVSPERQDFVDTDDARRLERTVVEFLNDWDELRDFDRDVLRRAITGERNGRPTINIARQIGRALQFKSGFRLNGTDGRNGGKKRRRKLAKAELYNDPTTIEGPGLLTIEQGATRMTRYHVNAKDAFLNTGRGELVIACDHPDIDEREITFGPLHNGFVRVAIAVPEDAELGGSPSTPRSAAGRRQPAARAAICAGRPSSRSSSPSPRRSASAAGASSRVTAMPTPPASWSASPGRAKATLRTGTVVCQATSTRCRRTSWPRSTRTTRSSPKLGDRKIPTIFLNRDYTPLKRYEAARGEQLTEGGIDRARDRYAVGVGLGLLLLDKEMKGREIPVSPEVELAAKQAAAQATLVMMSAYDRLAREAGVEE